MINDYYVYIMTNRKDGVLYIGVTNNLKHRAEEHKSGSGSKFTCKYKLDRLVYYEIFTDPENAIRREKQLKGGSRKKKIELLEKNNPKWKDIYFEL